MLSDSQSTLNNFEPRVDDRTKKLEDKLDLVLNNNLQTEDRIKKLEEKLGGRTKTLEDKLNTILEHIKSNKL